MKVHIGYNSLGHTWSATYVVFKANFKFAPIQWETALLCNDVSHWQGASLESAMSIDDLVMLNGCGFRLEPPNRYETVSIRSRSVAGQRIVSV